MNLLRSIHQLPRNEKLLLMEYLWKDLSEDKDEFEIPEWHKSVLTETETRVEEGKEEAIDWTVAKRQLRKNFE